MEIKISKKVDFKLTKEFDTTTCPYCGVEYLTFIIFRYENIMYEEEEAEILGVMTPIYCPSCGENLAKLEGEY